MALRTKSVLLLLLFVTLPIQLYGRLEAPWYASLCIVKETKYLSLLAWGSWDGTTYPKCLSTKVTDYYKLDGHNQAPDLGEGPSLLLYYEEDRDVKLQNMTYPHESNLVAIVEEEFRRITIFLKEHPDFSTDALESTTNGVVFVFPNTIPAIPAISRAIGRPIRGEMLKLRLPRYPYAIYVEADSKFLPIRIGLPSHRATYVASGISSFIGLVIFLIHFLYKKWHGD